MKPSQRYQQALQSSSFKMDPAQQQLVKQLDVLCHRLVRRAKYSVRLPVVLRSFVFPKPIRGLYLWGGVGMGKTFLMDLCYDSLPFVMKQRMHFHRFMQHIHQQLKEFQGQANPLKCIAKAWANKIQVLCLDEFIVQDIADAMLLAELLAAFFSYSICVLTTSNLSPDALYHNGLQRTRFLPAIQLLKQHCDCYELQAVQDYRLRLLTQATLYQYPLSRDSNEYLRQYFNDLVRGEFSEHTRITVNQRTLQTEAVSPNVVWFDFKNLCTIPRSQQDYLELARCYHTVLVSNVPLLIKDDWARNFIHLVDVFYDHRVKLILTAATELAALYPKGRLVFEFQRTLSRLTEMHSSDYLSQAHLP